MMSREIDNIRVEVIESLPGRRPVNQETVARLMESIKRIGLRTPLSVRLVDDFEAGDGEIIDGQPVLVTGAHRLEAVRRLGWEKVECFVLSDETEAQARMWEISENLHRADLSALERSEQVAEWIRLADETEKLRQSDAVSNKGGRGKKSGTRQASREIGVSEPAARRAVKVASLTPEAKEAARELKLDDNRSALLAAAKAEPDQQAEVIRKIADEKAERALVKPQKTVSIQKLVKVAEELPEWTAREVRMSGQRHDVEIALRDSQYHLQRAAECIQAAVAADPRLAVPLGAPLAQLLDLRELLAERVR